MSTITINIPDAVTQRVIEGIAYALNYSPTIEDDNGNPLPNPENKAQFAKRKLIEHIKRLVRNAEVEQAKNQAATTAAQSVDNDIDIT